MAKEEKSVRRAGEIRSVFPYRESVTVWGRERVTAQGCRRILTYTETCIRLLRRHEILTVQGKGLACISFSCGCATLTGTVQSVTFEKSEDEKS